MKNLTPSQIVFRTVVIIFIFIFVTEFVAWNINPFHTFWFQVFIIPALICAVAYFVFFTALEKFIYRKIKLIYKNIHDLKSTKQLTDQKVDMGKDIVSEVNEEVLAWAKDSSKEIDQLKKLENYRKEFLGNVSHELKTPITSIQGYLETLIDGGISDPDINRDYLLKAMRNVDRMVSVIDDLESIARLETGELPLHFSVFDINELTKDVFEGLEMQAEQMGIKMQIKDGCDKTFLVYADKKMIREVIVNFISNAIKYGKENGTAHVGFYNMGDNVMIEISDNGIGIAKEHLQRVFERFYRIEKSRSRDFGGTGLGLSIVKHIVEAHGQIISVRSTMGEGSTFGFTLKRAR
ncbi:MAG: sensor histidine kinase [Chitinophagales bacterium]|nr:sensor histidine kinase [Chitinophagales bacterium]